MAPAPAVFIVPDAIPDALPKYTPEYTPDPTAEAENTPDYTPEPEKPAKSTNFNLQVQDFFETSTFRDSGYLSSGMKPMVNGYENVAFTAEDYTRL